MERGRGAQEGGSNKGCRHVVEFYLHGESPVHVLCGFGYLGKECACFFDGQELSHTMCVSIGPSLKMRDFQAYLVFKYKNGL